MSRQDVMHHYIERDDEPDADPVEVIDYPCPGCGKIVRAPIDADGDDTCCSPECVRVVCDRMDAEIEAMAAEAMAEAAAERAAELAAAREPVPVADGEFPW